MTPQRMLVVGLGLSALFDIVPWSYCMSGDAYGLPFPIVFPRHGEDHMLLGWVTGDKGGGTVVDLSAIAMNASICIAIVAVLGFGHRAIAALKARA
jgi:hypothetical protein